MRQHLFHYDRYKRAGRHRVCSSAREGVVRRCRSTILGFHREIAARNCVEVSLETRRILSREEFLRAENVWLVSAANFGEHKCSVGAWENWMNSLLDTESPGSAKQ